ncbi:galactose-binding domain-containing protein [Neolewinella xylanilytica]|uniref:galactose-binding domain-containing protein n=1 Tax=Neolewinella xylanilytica TaxID=1514080 RepID=UPI00147334AC|nr:discoidin domain-containing protein [Neolewinella xylanilytica]
MTATAQGTINLARGRPGTASTSIDGNVPGRAFDGNTGSRWESEWRIDPQWIYVDLGASFPIGRVQLIWEGAYARDYLIQVSDNATDWQTVRTVTGNTQLSNNLTGLNTDGRYVRVYGTARGSIYGYSLYEFRVYGTDNAPAVSLTSPAGGASFLQSAAIPLAANATAQGSKTISRVDFFSGTDLIGSVTTPPYTLTWTNAPAGTHTLTARATDSNNLTSDSEPVAITVTRENLARNRPAVASTRNDIARAAFDGNLGSRWESVHGVDPQWIYVDLGEEYAIDQVRLTWETAYASDFRIEVSSNATDWTTVASRTNARDLGNRLVNDVTAHHATGRYVRMFGTGRTSDYGYSLYEFEVYGTQGVDIIAAPAAESVYTAPGAVDVVVDGGAAGTNAYRIELLVDGVVVDTRGATPSAYTVPVTGLAAGNYALAARIYYTDGSVTGASTVPVYVIPATTGGESCGDAITVSAAGAPAGGTYRWYTVPTGGAPIAGETGPNFVTPPVDITTTYYVAAVGPDGAESHRAAAAVRYIGLAQPSTEGLTMAYPFHGSGTDATGGGNDAIVSGATLAPDRFGRADAAYRFDGVDDYITTTTSFPTNIEGTNTFSVSLWFRTTTGGGGKLLGMGTSQTGNSGEYDRHLYMNNAGQLLFGIYLGAHLTIKTEATFNDDQWHNVVATVSPDGMHLYVDGALKAEDTSITEGQKYGGPGYWRIGYDNLAGWPERPSSDHFAGLLDDVNIYYATKLSPGDRTGLYGASVDTVEVGETLELRATFLENVTYAWTGPGGFVSAQQNPTIPGATTANAGDYTVTVSNATCTSFPLTVNAVVIASAILPVELVSFSAEPAGEAVQLHWATALEVDNRGFEVQRSTNRSDFEGIVFVQGAGNSFTGRPYAFLDHPSVTGTVYYRLKQIDFEGGATYSEVIAVRLAPAESFLLFPNPAERQTTLRWNTGVAGGTVLLTLIDSRGRTVRSDRLQEARQQEHQLDLAGYAPGLYTLLLHRDGQLVYESKLVRR